MRVLPLLAQVVLASVYLLAPGKRAYLRNLKDLEEQLTVHRWPTLLIALSSMPADHAAL